MTLEEAKNLLKKEGFELKKAPYVHQVSDEFKRYESPEVLEAMRIVGNNMYVLSMKSPLYEKRKARLKMDYAIESSPALKKAASGFNDAMLDEQKKQIDELNEECTRLRCVVEKKENAISRLHFEKELLEQEVEKFKTGKLPAKYFDTALVDEQAKKIKYQSEKIAAYKKQFAHLAKVLHEKNNKIDVLRKESSKHLRDKVKTFYENQDLEKKLADKDAVLSDVAEELRLSKVREEELMATVKDYLKEIENLKKELANTVVNNVDAQALKSAESALTYKEKTIESFQRKNNQLEKLYCKARKQLSEKDEVIKDLGDELAECEERKSQAYKSLREKNRNIESLKAAIHTLDELREKDLERLEKAQEKHDKNRRASTEAVAIYVDAVTKAELDGLVLDFWENDGNKITAIYQSKNGKRSKLCLDFTGKQIVFSRSNPDKKKPTPEEPKHVESFEEFKQRLIDSYNKTAERLATVGSKDGKGILDQMEKKPYPTEDNPEEIEIEDAVNEIREALKAHKTVIIESEPDEPVVTCALSPDDYWRHMKELINSTL